MTLPSNTFIDGMSFVRAGGSKVALNRAGATVSCGVALASDRGIAISANPTSESGFDVELYRAGVGVFQFGGGSAGSVSAAQMSRPVEASTAGVGSPNLLAATESRKALTNHGVTAEAYNTLPPSAPVGCEFLAYCADADGIRVTAPSGETIRTGPGAVSAAAGFIRSVVIGSGITLTKVAATEWAAINAPNGTWTIDI